MNHKLIFTGAELTGKSYLIHNVWDTLEKKYNTGKSILDGCTWINTDVGLYGSPKGWLLIQSLLNLAESLVDSNLIFEKFHITQWIYREYREAKLFETINKKVQKLGFKIIFTTFSEDENLIQKRITERTISNSSYARIVKPITWYYQKQKEYRKVIQASGLPFLEIDNSVIPNQNHQVILNWLGE